MGLVGFGTIGQLVARRLAGEPGLRWLAPFEEFPAAHTWISIAFVIPTSG